MNLFTRNSPYYHLLKYLLFFLKHPVYGRDASWCGSFLSKDDILNYLMSGILFRVEVEIQ